MRISDPTPQSFKYFSLGQQWVLFILALFLLSILYFRFYRDPDPLPKEEDVQEFVVEVTGDVLNPGVHIFQHAPSLKEAIEKAGGWKGAASFDTRLSLDVLETGTLLTVVKESPQGVKIKLGRMEARKLLVFSLPLDLNRASTEDLCLIPGIGESLAQEIVNYRDRRRAFRSIEELKNVKGIGDKKWKTFEKFFIVKP